MTTSTHDAVLNPNCFEGSVKLDSLQVVSAPTMKDQLRESLLQVHKWKAMGWLTAALYQNQFGHAPIWVLSKYFGQMKDTPSYIPSRKMTNWLAGFFHAAQAHFCCCRSFQFPYSSQPRAKMNKARPENCQKVIVSRAISLKMGSAIQTCWGPKMAWFRHKLNHQFQGN